MRGSEDELNLRDGRRVSVWDGGDPKGRPVVFFHGCPDSRRAAILGHEAAITARVRLIAASRPGYSGSELPGHGESGESGGSGGSGGSGVSGREHVEVADDTVEVADLLGLDRFAVVGMSVGGPYAVATAARHPDRVRAVGVVEAPAEVPRLDPPTHRDDLDEARRAFFEALTFTPASVAAEQMRPEFEAYVARVDPTDHDDAELAHRWLVTLPPADAALVRAAGDAEVARMAREAVGRTSGYLRDAAVSFRSWPFDAGDVRCPVLAWYGDGDDTYSPRNGRWYADTLGATLVLYPGASHLGTLLEHWGEILGALADR